METTVQEVVNSYNEYLKKVPEGCNVIAELLRQDQIQHALENVSNFADGAMWLMETAELLEKSGANVILDIEKMNDYLNEIVQSIEMQDYYLVADLFEYELVPFFSEVEQATIEQ